MSDSPRIAVLGGTSLLTSSLFSYLEPASVPTEYGSVIVYSDPSSKNPLLFVQRHHADAKEGASVYFPPHRINHRAIFSALRSLNCRYIIGVCSVGSVNPEFPPGKMIIPDDYFQLFGPPVCFHDDKRGHIVPGFDEDLRSCMGSALRAANVPELLATKGTYIQTVGPRFETKAEVRFLSTLKIGHVLGMTGASETTMAKEVGIPYAILCMIDNMANGMGADDLSEAQFRANVARHQPIVENSVRIILAAVMKKAHEGPTKPFS